MTEEGIIILNAYFWIVTDLPLNLMNGLAIDEETRDSTPLIMLKGKSLTESV